MRPPRPEVARLVTWDATEYAAEIRLDSNENPYRVPDVVLDEWTAALRDEPLNRYPDPFASSARTAIAETLGISPDNVLLGNGSDELVLNALLAWGGPSRKLLVLPPSFSIYAFDAMLSGADVVTVPRDHQFGLDTNAVLSRVAAGDIDAIAVANPNNPTGTLIPPDDLARIAGATDALLIVDEAYFDFSGASLVPYIADHPNIVVTRTLSKGFSLAGARIGFLVASEEVVRTIATVRQPFSVDRVSARLAEIAWRHRDAVAGVVAELVDSRVRLAARMTALPGVTVFPSAANFLLFRVPDATAVWRELLARHSVLVRNFSRVGGLENCLRVTVGTPYENDRFAKALAAVLTQAPQAADAVPDRTERAAPS